MSAITPDTDVILLKVPLEITQDNQLTFSNATAQYNYFHNLPRLELEDFTYQRKDGVIRCGILADDLYQYNYVMYRNNNFSSKWFYAFIDKVEYLNHNTSAIAIRTDVWQSWQFDLDYKPTFVEREHVNNDAIGAHTIHEGLEKGEMVINGMATETIAPSGTVTDWENLPINAYNLITFQLTEGLPTAPNGEYAGSVEWYGDNKYNGIFSGLLYVGVQTAQEARNLIWAYDKAGKGDAIVAIFLAPAQMFQGAHRQDTTFLDKVTGMSANADLYIPLDVDYPSNLGTTTLDINSSLDGYTPKNNKLFTKEFNYLYLTNNAGTDLTYFYEDFDDPSHPSFYMGGNIGQGCSIKLSPIGYKHGYDSQAEEYSFGINGAKYPVCAWSSDYYTNWLTQNAVNMGASAITSTVSGFASGGAAGAIMSGVGSVFNSMVQATQASIIPDQAKGNTNCSDITFSWRRFFSVKRMSVRSEMARVIDDYFSMYGYKVNSVKVPNITGRTNWNYVKTIGCYIKADIPQEDLKEIKDMFNNGVTFWHNPATFADYSQNNAIVV